MPADAPTMYRHDSVQDRLAADTTATGDTSVGRTTAGSHADASRRSGEGVAWRTSPIDRDDLLVVVLTVVGATGVLTLIGLALVQWWDGTAAGELDADVNRWLADRRTDDLTAVAEVVSRAGDGAVKVALALVLAPVMLRLFRRWHEYALVVGGLLLETLVFAFASTLVGRGRPPVDRLLETSGSSFPSGHVAAAAVCFGGLAALTFAHTGRSGPRAVAVGVALVATVTMAWARMYLGLAFSTDAVAGAALGFLLVAVLRSTILGERATRGPVRDGASTTAVAPSPRPSPRNDRSAA